MKIIACSLLSIAIGLSSAAANTATVITEAFDAAAAGSSVPDGWKSTHPSLTEIKELDGRYRQLIFRETPKDKAGAAIYYTGSQGSVSGGSILNFDAEVTLRFKDEYRSVSSSLRGMVFRTQSPDFRSLTPGDFWGYSVGVITTGDNAGLHLFVNPTGFTFNDQGNQLAFSPFPVDLNTDYVLKVSAHGSEISASILSSDQSEVLATITFDGAKEQAGYVGLRAAYPNTQITTYYSDLKISVPAP